MSYKYIDPNIQDPVEHPPYTEEFGQAYYTELREAFRLFDADNDGVITYSELFKVIKYLHKWDFIREQRMNEEAELEEKRLNGEVDRDQEQSQAHEAHKAPETMENDTQGENKDALKDTAKSPKGKASARKSSTQKTPARKGKKDTKDPEEEKVQTVEAPLPSPEDLFIIPDPTDEELRDLIKYATGRLGIMDHITFEEFASLMQKQIENTPPEEHFQEAFNVFDKDRDGFISMTELRDALTDLVGIESISQEDLFKFMKELDSDGDMLLSYEDFVKMFLNMAQLQAP